MNAKKLTALLCLFSLLLTLTISCAENKEPNVNENETASTTVGQEEVQSNSESQTSKYDIKDGLPELNFNGRVFKLYTYGHAINQYEFLAEEVTGDVFNDAVYNRNKVVEERLNIKLDITYSGEGSTTVGEMAEKNVKTGDHVYDLYNGHIMRMGQSILKNCFMDVYDLNYIDFSQPWWPKYAVQNLSYGKHAYLMVGEMNLSALLASYAVFFNKDMAKNNGVDPSEIYKLVLDGKWTIDKQTIYTKDFYNDLNGNQSFDAEDQFGLTCNTAFSASAYSWGFGQTLCKPDENGYPVLNIPNPLMNTAIEKIYDLYYNSEGVQLIPFGTDWTTSFSSGRSFMMNHYLNTAITLRDAEVDFGIIPYPKLNEDQANYYTIADGFHNAFAVPTTTAESDYGYVGAILEALNSETYRLVLPAYYDTALKVKYSRDDDTVKCLDIITEGRVFDFGCVYDGWTGFAFTISDLMNDKSTNFASYYEKKEKAATKYFDKIIACFQKLD